MTLHDSPNNFSGDIEVVNAMNWKKICMVKVNFFFEELDCEMSAEKMKKITAKNM